MADTTVGARVDNAIESIRNQYSLIADGVKDLRKYDIVVNLGADKINAGNTLLYVGKDGKGDIQRIEDSVLKSQQPSVKSNILGVSDVSVAGVKSAQDSAARLGASVVMKNVDVLARDGAISFPFNPEKPQAAKAESLPEIKAMLTNIRGDLLNGAAPDYKLDEEGRVDGVKYKDNTGLDVKIKEIEKALTAVDKAIALPVYSADLKADLQNKAALFTPEQARSIDTSLADTRSIADKLNDIGNAPMTKVYPLPKN